MMLRAWMGDGSRRAILPLAGALIAIACSPGAAHAVNFTGPTTIAVGSSPQSVITGNFNGDSDPDLAVVSQNANNVSVLLGGAGASFSAPATLTAGMTPLAAVAADFNGDADPELAVVNEASNDVSILVGGAGGTFSGPTNYLVGTTPQSLGVGDFNGDSDPDLAVVNEGSSNVSILLGGAGATFGAATNFGVGGLPRALTVADFNGDSDPDLAVANEATNNVSVLVGAAGGTFTGPTNVSVCSAPTWIASGQFNGDSDPDLAIANQGSDNMSVLVGGLGAGFIGPVDFAIGDGPTAVAVADFDADADRDVAITTELSNNVAIMLTSSTSGHPRPKGATPLLVALLPAYTKCTAPNRLHGPPALGGGSDDGSCAPPVQTSGFLTVGTPDAGGGTANSSGSVRLDVIIGAPGPPDDSDVAIHVDMSDVRCKTGVATCGAANAAGGADYTGELTPNIGVRVTDNFNAVPAGGGTDGATMQDYVLGGSVQVPCAATASTAIGASCAISTTLDAISPGTVLDGKRAVWQLGQVEVLDGGSDGEATTTPNGRFAVQGLFVP